MSLFFRCHLVFGGVEPLDRRDGGGGYLWFISGHNSRKGGAVDTASLSLTLCP